MIFKNITSDLASFKKINDLLKKTHKVSISESSTQDELLALRESSQAKMKQIKHRESSNRMQNPEYTKHKLIVEATTALLATNNDKPAKTNYEKVVSSLATYVVEYYDTGVALHEALDSVIKLAKQAKVQYPAYDLYASVKSRLVEDSQEFRRRKKEPMSANVWDLVSPERRANAADTLRKMKDPKSADWELVDMDDEDPVKGFLDPNIIKRNPHQPVPGRRDWKGVRENSPENAARREMRENTVKKVRMLVENEVEQAEVISAARNFGRQLQNMVEKIGRLQNEDLGPVIDQMRLAFGNDTATDFNDIVNGQLQSILDQLKNAREQIDVTVTDVAIRNQISVGNDMDDVDGSMAPMGGPDDMGGDLGAPVGDEFGGDIAASGVEDDPLGRAKKESIMHIKNKILETQNLLKALRESKK